MVLDWCGERMWRRSVFASLEISPFFSEALHKMTLRMILGQD
jgi:hypothetical protein